MVALQPLVTEFTLIGRLADLTINSKGQIKYLILSTPKADYAIAVAKEQTKALSKYLQPGCHLKVVGMRKYKLHQEEVQYKAYRIELLSESASAKTKAIDTQFEQKVLICQNANCWQQGGKAAYEKLQQELKATGKTDTVEIVSTGCLKQCKQAPNLIVMPGRKRYGKVQPRQISELIERHF